VSAVVCWWVFVWYLRHLCVCVPVFMLQCVRRWKLRSSRTSAGRRLRKRARSTTVMPKWRCAYRQYSVRVWRRLCHFGEDCAVLENIVPFWRRLCRFGEDCAVLEKTVPFWRSLCRFSAHYLCFREDCVCIACVCAQVPAVTKLMLDTALNESSRSVTPEAYQKYIDIKKEFDRDMVCVRLVLHARLHVSMLRSTLCSCSIPNLSMLICIFLCCLLFCALVQSLLRRMHVYCMFLFFPLFCALVQSLLPRMHVRVSFPRAYLHLLSSPLFCARVCIFTPFFLECMFIASFYFLLYFVLLFNPCFLACLYFQSMFIFLFLFCLLFCALVQSLLPIMHVCVCV